MTELAAEQAEADKLAAEQAVANATTEAEAAALANMDTTVNQTTTETDWWSQYGVPYPNEAAAIASGFFEQITGPNGAVAWVPKGPPDSGEGGETDINVNDLNAPNLWIKQVIHQMIGGLNMAILHTQMLYIPTNFEFEL